VLINAPLALYKYTAPIPAAASVENVGSATTMLPFARTWTDTPKFPLPAGPGISIWIADALVAHIASSQTRERTQYGNTWPVDQLRGGTMSDLLVEKAYG
jgi:hypothetical protein